MQDLDQYIIPIFSTPEDPEDALDWLRAQIPDNYHAVLITGLMQYHNALISQLKKDQNHG